MSLFQFLGCMRVPCRCRPRCAHIGCTICLSVCGGHVSGVCVEGRSILGLGNLPQMKLDSLPGNQCKKTFQSCRKSISTWWDSPTFPLLCLPLQSSYPSYHHPSPLPHPS